MKKYLIDGEVYEESDFREELESAISDYVDENYDDLLDEIYDEVKIGYCTFYASEILKNCDPITYRCGIDDFVNSELEDALSDLESGFVNIGGRQFLIEEDDEEEAE